MGAEHDGARAETRGAVQEAERLLTGRVGAEWGRQQERSKLGLVHPAEIRVSLWRLRDA